MIKLNFKANGVIKQEERRVIIGLNLRELVYVCVASSISIWILVPVCKRKEKVVSFSVQVVFSVQKAEYIKMVLKCVTFNSLELN